MEGGFGFKVNCLIVERKVDRARIRKAHSSEAIDHACMGNCRSQVEGTHRISLEIV